MDYIEMRTRVLAEVKTMLGLDEIETELVEGTPPQFVVRWRDRSMGAYLDQHPEVRLAALGGALARTMLVEHTKLYAVPDR